MTNGATLRMYIQLSRWQKLESESKIHVMGYNSYMMLKTPLAI